MVRVLTVHNFASQDIQVVEQPTASTVAPPHRLLLALSNHSIEVRDLKTESNLLFTFPTVDRVTQLIHCLNGDYIATVETKSNRQNREFNYVRVYVNWDNIATLQQSKMTNSGASLDSSECGMVQPMRARIAGRVTPTTNQSELSSLEMIEIPVRQNPQAIECCQISGNLLIQVNKCLIVYTFQIRTHDISKLKFIDFEELPIYIEISFVPLKVAFSENYIACLNKDRVHTFKIMSRTQKASEDSNEVENCDNNYKPSDEDVTIDYRELLNNERTNKIKHKLTVNLPSVVKSNSIIHKHSPFTYTDKEMRAIVRHNFPVEDKAHNYEIVHLTQLKLEPITIENTQTQVMEEFKCLILKPLYVEGVQSANDYYKPLSSDYRNCLAGVVCVITTLQEGYLFQFSDSDFDSNIDHCISVYPFMGPIYNIVLEDYLLHALTETGLESYTVRVGHSLCKSFERIDDLNIACPPEEELLSLIGHRQFIGIEQMLLADKNLVLLANADTSPTHSVGSNSSSNASFWTLYNLELPTPKMIFNDINIAANNHRFSAPQTYCHLLSEAHMILRLSLLLMKWSVSEGNVSKITAVKNNVDDLLNIYRKSCALLGDHFIMNENFTLCLPYYKMAMMSSFDVLKRFKRVQNESNIEFMKGILYYLKMVMSESKLKSCETTSKTAWKQNFIEEVLNIFESHNFNDLPHLILKNKTLREYSTCRFINVLSHQSYGDLDKDIEKTLALALLYVQECNIEEAEKMINSINDSRALRKHLLDNWKLLFEYSAAPSMKHKNTLSFTEFSILLMFTHGDILASVFVNLINDRRVGLHNILWMFLEYLPSRVGTEFNKASEVMEKTLEEYFKTHFSNCEIKDFPILMRERPSVQEALTILVRSYLSQLQVLHMKITNSAQTEITTEDNEKQENGDEMTDSSKTFFQSKGGQNKEDFLFADLRLQYLNKMPPFQVEITSKLYETCMANYVPKESFPPSKEGELILRKLQALLCSKIISDEIIAEANTFMVLNKDMIGFMSLKSILLNVNDAVEFLLDWCPQCLLQFGKDRFTKNEEWKYLLFSIQKKIIQLSKDPILTRICFFHKKILKDVLTHLATTLHVEQFLSLLPNHQNDESEDYIKNKYEKEVNIGDNDVVINDMYNYDSYIIMCKETMHADQIKKLITTTGQQLLCTLNL